MQVSALYARRTATPWRILCSFTPLLQVNVVDSACTASLSQPLGGTLHAYITRSPVSELNSMGVSGGCLSYCLILVSPPTTTTVASPLSGYWTTLRAVGKTWGSMSVDLQDACPNSYN